MRQSWRHLLFAHWSLAPEKLKGYLPEGLEPDLFEGKAWIGIVPFYMQKVRPVGFPALPWISDFLELNVRTYVRGPDGTRGVWFFSLDCDQPLAVEVARLFFKLPYYHARIKAEIRNGIMDYRCWRYDRRSPVKGKEESGWRYRLPHQVSPALSGSLEYFLVERYVLFSQSGRQLYNGRVEHRPYEIAVVELQGWDSVPLQLDGLPTVITAPEHVCYSPGVDVNIYPLGRVCSETLSQPET